ncbi:MAG: hypothetical protein ACREQX_15965 [Candidatus Binataceae bacterium]
MLIRKIMGQRSARYRILRERLTEPLHLNLASMLVAGFGGFRARVAWDLVQRAHYAYGLLEGADQARAAGLDSFTAVEFGVAAGEGLLNLCKIAERIKAATGVTVQIAGFDTGQGMPPPTDYRDHPEQFATGDFPMDFAALRARLPANCRLVLGPVGDTVEQFRRTVLNAQAPLGFVAFDLDYYSSTKQAFALLTDPNAAKYLFLPLLYFDDIVLPSYSDWAGELLAINEFNAEQQMRKIQQYRFLRSRRFKKRTLD